MFDSHIGKYCENPECKIQDYLPITCTKGCNKTFCNSCFNNHLCIDVKKTKYKKYKNEICCHNKCKTVVTEVLGYKCKNCNKITCIAHRHQHSDICKSINLEKKVDINKSECKKKYSIFRWICKYK